MAVISNNDWDPLEEIIVGIADNALQPPMDISTHCFVYGGEKWEDIQHLQGTHEPWVLEEGQEDLDRLADTLKSLGVTVHRPESIDNTKEFSTPEWKARGWYNFCPRDLMLPLDNLIIECPSPMRGRYFETRAYRKYLYDQMKDGTQWICAPKPVLEDDSYQFDNLDIGTLKNNEIVFDAANIVRLGKDLLCQVSNSGNQLGFEWLQTVLKDKGYRVHTVEKLYSFAHFDSTILPLRPGLVLFNAERVTPDNYPKIFKDWDKIWFHPDRLAVPSANLDGGIAPCSTSIGLNFLSVNPELVICDIEQEELRKELSKWGIESIGLPCRQARTMSGGFHCSTLDVKRKGKLEDYFSK